MTNQLSSLDPAYFDRVYEANSDPWSFESSPYERDKYAATTAALSNKRYKSAFEIGCSIGVLTQLLAQRCDQLLAVDASGLPLQKATTRLSDAPNVTLRQMNVPAEFPNGPFNLILLSEVGYYWDMPDLTRARQLIIDQLQPGGHLLLVHWTPVVHDYPLTGDQVHDFFLERARTGGPLQHRLNQRQETYRLDLFEKR